MTYDPSSRPERSPGKEPSFYEQVRGYVAQAADAASALDVHLAGLPADAPWPVRLASQVGAALTRAASILSLHTGCAMGQLPVAGPTNTPEGTSRLAHAALRQLLFDAAALVDLLAQLGRAEASGQLAVGETDRRWMSLAICFAGQIMREEVDRADAMLAQTSALSPPKGDGPVCPPPSLN